MSCHVLNDEKAAFLIFLLCLKGLHRNAVLSTKEKTATGVSGFNCLADGCEPKTGITTQNL